MKGKNWEALDWEDSDGLGQVGDMGKRKSEGL